MKRRTKKQADVVVEVVAILLKQTQWRQRMKSILWEEIHMQTLLEKNVTDNAAKTLEVEMRKRKKENLVEEELVNPIHEKRWRTKVL